jgi:hypothetical protein
METAAILRRTGLFCGYQQRPDVVGDPSIRSYNLQMVQSSSLHRPDQWHQPRGTAGTVCAVRDT